MLDGTSSAGMHTTSMSGAVPDAYDDQSASASMSTGNSGKRKGKSGKSKGKSGKSKSGKLTKSKSGRGVGVKCKAAKSELLCPTVGKSAKSVKGRRGSDGKGSMS